MVAPKEIAGQPHKPSLDQLTAMVKTRLKRMQYRPHLIEGLIAKTGLDFQLPQPQPLKVF